jgi:hypothetical protein
MKTKKPPQSINSDANALQQYESLRAQGLNNKEIFYERSLGQALLIRRGMLAWIEVCHQCIPVNPKPIKRIKRSKTPVFSYETTSEMIKVMANITLFNLEEAYS